MLVPEIPGLEHIITSNEIFDLPELPKRILIVGGGYIAVEFGSLLARLGSEVTLAMCGENILRGFDQDLRVALREAMIHAGIAFKFDCLPTRIDKVATGFKVMLANGAALDVDQIMLATGRYLAFYPGSTIRFSGARLSIKALDLDMPPSATPFGVITLRGRTPAPATRLFIECARDVMKPWGPRRRGVRSAAS